MKSNKNGFTRDTILFFIALFGVFFVLQYTAPTYSQMAATGNYAWESDLIFKTQGYNTASTHRWQGNNLLDSEVVWTAPNGTVFTGTNPAGTSFAATGTYHCRIQNWSNITAMLFIDNTGYIDDINLKDLLYRMNNLTYFTFRNNSVIGENVGNWMLPDTITRPTNMFYNCTKIAYGNYLGKDANVSMRLPTNLLDGSYMFYTCIELRGDKWPPAIPNTLTNGIAMFYKCLYMSNSVANIFPAASYPNLLTTTGMFVNCRITGNASDFTGKTKAASYIVSTNKLTSCSLGTFSNCTYLSDWGTLGPEWK